MTNSLTQMRRLHGGHSSEMLKGANGFLIDYARAFLLSGEYLELPDSIDIGALVLIAERNKILPLLYSGLERKGVIGTKDFRILREKYASTQRRMNLIHNEGKKILTDLSRLGIDVLVQKGMTYNSTLYMDKNQRSFLDLDLLTRNDNDAGRIHEYLISKGYQAGLWDAGLSVFIPIESFVHKYQNGHEYLEYFKYFGSDAAVVEIGRTLHRYPQMYRLDPFEDNRVIVEEWGGYNTLSFEMIFLSLATNLYEDGISIYGLLFSGLRLRDYIDLGLFFKKYGNVTNWGKVANTLIKCSLVNEAVCVLELFSRFLNNIDLGQMKILNILKPLKVENRNRVELANSEDVRFERLHCEQYEYFLQGIGERLRDSYVNLVNCLEPSNVITDSCSLGDSAFEIRYLIEREIFEIDVTSSKPIGDDMVFSLAFVNPAANRGEEFTSVFLRKVNGELNAYTTQSDSFLSTGKMLEKPCFPSVNSACKANATEWKIQMDSLAFLKTGFRGSAVLYYTISIHREVAENVFYHIKGDDSEILSSPRVLKHVFG